MANPSLAAKRKRGKPSAITIDESTGLANVSLTRGFEALIDVADIPLVAGRSWHIQIGQHGHAYAATTENGRLVAMHRKLLGATKGQFVDHRDGDGLNNRRSNIRLCTQAQNLANKVVERRNKLGVKGVSPDRLKFRARIKPDGRIINLGSYATQEEAAAAYRGAAIVLWGEFAKS